MYIEIDFKFGTDIFNISEDIDTAAYVAALEGGLAARWPDADISVEYVSRVCNPATHAEGIDLMDVEDAANEILEQLASERGWW